jgi:O-antigen/teichoic acid export membrane protein
MTRSLPSLRASALANYLGQGWSALMGIAFLPLYVEAIGVESYALIGFFAVLQVWMGLLDLGLTPTLNREMARLRAGAHTARSIRDLLRSLEIICATLVAVAVLALSCAAEWLATSWLKLEGLSPGVVVEAFRIMAFVLGIRLVEQIYRGALQGGQDQIWLNQMSALLATLRWGGAYLVVTRISPDVSSFFLWQGAVSILATVLLAIRTYRILPPCAERGRFDPAALTEVYHFARGMFLGSVLSFLLTQVDKLAVSKLLPLSELGFYTLASTLAGGLMQLVTPLTTAVYPRLTVQVASEDHAGLRNTYLASCEWMAAIIVPPSMVIAIFPDFVLRAWTGNATLVAHVAPLLAVLVLGNLANALVNVPYMLQLAHGWTSLAIRVNLIAVIAFIPLVLWAVPRFGGPGAAGVWLALNLAYLLLGIQFMYRRLLTATKWAWYRDAVLLPVAAGGSTALLLRLVAPVGSTRLEAGVFAVAAALLVLIAVVLVLPAVRRSCVAELFLRLRISRT